MQTPAANSWLAPPSNLALPGDEVHVWRATLDLDAAQVEALAATLTPDESRRAAHYRQLQAGDRFRVAHGVLRSILSRYLGLAPGELSFACSRHGKPALAGDLCDVSLRFNLSHSGGLALYAVTWNRKVGVDLEYIRAGLDYERLARHFFAPGEAAALQALDPDARARAFYACWSRKEAFVKATGQGLALPLHQFEVSVHPTQPARLLWVQGQPHEADHWSLRDLSPGQGYAAALTTEKGDWRLACWHWIA